MMKRRHFLQTTTAGVSTLLTSSAFSQTKIPAEKPSNRLHVSLSQYCLSTFYDREGIDYMSRLNLLRDFGADSVEPTASSADWLETFCPKLKDNGLEIKSIYVSGNLHNENIAENEIDRIVKITETARKYGTVLIVYNPDVKQGKSDAELQTQYKNTDKLGEKINSLGAKLLFHYHTSELGFGGREFHSLLCNTNPEFLGLCLEQLWSFRGCGHSQQALFDHIKLYQDRIFEVHLRQTANHVLCEAFEDGDIDNVRLAAELRKLKTPPHLLIEQSPVDAKTPKTISADESIRRSITYVRRVFSV
ncbi:MAG: TIM barrel protein [Planctomycetaceae bacterium]|jgi:sugar phosphate isomerase/epimerase|nr:TIM barrel protein [Planctomycetaceae bacterium]